MLICFEISSLYTYQNNFQQILKLKKKKKLNMYTYIKLRHFRNGPVEPMCVCCTYGCSPADRVFLGGLPKLSVESIKVESRIDRRLALALFNRGRCDIRSGPVTKQTSTMQYNTNT